MRGNNWTPSQPDSRKDGFLKVLKKYCEVDKHLGVWEKSEVAQQQIKGGAPTCKRLSLTNSFSYQV